MSGRSYPSVPLCQGCQPIPVVDTCPGICVCSTTTEATCDLNYNYGELTIVKVSRREVVICCDQLEQSQHHIKSTMNNSIYPISLASFESNGNNGFQSFSEGAARFLVHVGNRNWILWSESEHSKHSATYGAVYLFKRFTHPVKYRATLSSRKVSLLWLLQHVVLIFDWSCQTKAQPVQNLDLHLQTMAISRQM